MPTLTDLKQIIKSDLKKFDDYFASLMRTDRGLLNLVLKYVLKTKGKQLRPILVFYSSKLCGEINQRSHIAAALIELLHTATLVHDDVVDNSQMRRGFFSIKALWQSKIAVLIGDYLLAKGLLISVDNNAYDLLKVVSNAVKEMAEGEILQLEKARNLDISEDLYFEIIRKKTAALISAATTTGTLAVTDDEKKISLMRDLGIYLGIAFQIKDDLFDYEANTNIIGKPIGNDIQEKKATLPLIYALNKAPKKQAKQILRLLGKNQKSKKEVQQVIDFAKEFGGVDYAKKTMNYYKQQALDILTNNFPDTEIKTNFVDLINFIVERKK